MKITVLLLTISIWTVVAENAHAQNAKVSLSVKDEKLDRVLNSIEKQTDYLFIYNSKQVSIDRKVSVTAKEKPVKEVLNELFAGTNVNYAMEGSHIVLRNGEPASVQVEQQTGKLSGTVVDETGEPIIGANVSIKGTTIGTITDMDGKFILERSDSKSILVVSYVGYATQELPVGGKSVFHIQLTSSNIKLDEVVVTALGLKREKKALGYSVGEVKSAELNRVPQQDALGSLVGKVAGVKITSSSEDINSDTYVTIRGITSLAGNTSPLIVVDGVPAGDQKVLKDINPENIENISVLKGPSAAALYGSRAGNGVILITSKSGAGAGKGVTVDVGYGATFVVPHKYLDMQRRFTTGKSGKFDEGLNQQWFGPERGTTQKYVQWNTDGVAENLNFYDNQFSDYFQTGVTHNTDASVSGNFDRGTFRISYSNLTGSGVLPGMDLKRNSVNLSGIYELRKNIKLSTNMELSNPYSNNYPMDRSNYTNPYSAIYDTPPHVNVNDLKEYWLIENEKQRSVSTSANNPWYSAYQLVSKFNRFRGVGNVKFEWEIIKDLKLMARYSISGTGERNSVQQPWNTYGGDGGVNGTTFGRYRMAIANAMEMNADVLLSYRKTLGKFDIVPSIGGNLMRQRSYSSSSNGDNLTVPGLYTVANIQKSNLVYGESRYRKDINSLYGTLGLSYNNMLFLDMTARNDWSSTLPVNNRSYFYPSVSVSALINEMVQLPKAISLIKIRGGYAQVGKDTDPYVIATLLSRSMWGDNTTYSVPASLPNVNLKPEIATSFEVGADLGFFNNRLGLDATYYIAQNRNQILSAATSLMSGYKSALINAGNIENQGVEITLRTVPVQTKEWNWNLNINFTKERSKLKELTPGIDRFQFWESTQVYAYTDVNESVGDLWGRDVLRVTEGPYTGWPLLNPQGKLQGNNNQKVKIGNYLPDFMLGVQTELSWKGFTLSASFDWRQGGVFTSEARRRLARSGKVEINPAKAHTESTFTGILSNNTFGGDMDRLAQEIKNHPEIYQQSVWVGGRTQELGGFSYLGGNDGAFYPGVISDGKGGYIENFGGNGTQYIQAWDVFSPSGGFWDVAVGEHWTYDASFLKLRELALSYKLPGRISQRVFAKDISVSAFLKNVLLWSAAKTHTDPENIYAPQETGVLRQGLSSWNGPITLSTGFRVNITF